MVLVIVMLRHFFVRSENDSKRIRAILLKEREREKPRTIEKESKIVKVVTIERNEWQLVKIDIIKGRRYDKTSVAATYTGLYTYGPPD